MKWIGDRISFVDAKNKTTIVIKPERSNLVNATIGAWIFMWYGIGITISISLFTLNLTQQEQIALIIFMTFWIYYAIRVTRSFLWLMWGSENLMIDELGLVIKNSTGKYGKAKVYYLENIKKMGVEMPKKKSLQAVWEASPWVNGGERIIFDYVAKKVRFGKKITEKEAELLFNLVTKRIEDHLKRKAKREKSISIN